MFNVDEGKDSIRFKLSSEMKLVDRVVNEAISFLSQDAGGDLSGIKLVLRELLINAVEHGNQKIAALSVSCSIERIGESLYKIQIEDEGNGFAWKAVKLSVPDDPGKVRSRGLPLVNTLADHLEFNESGNAVTVHVMIPLETGYAVRGSDGFSVIVPSGDITAASSEKLRELLSGLLDSGMLKCRFDFSKVRDIDSVGLSALVVLSRILEERCCGRPELEIENAPDDIVRLFQMTMLDTIYRLLPQTRQA